MQRAAAFKHNQSQSTFHLSIILGPMVNPSNNTVQKQTDQQSLSVPRSDKEMETTTPQYWCVGLAVGQEGEI